MDWRDNKAKPGHNGTYEDIYCASYSMLRNITRSTMKEMSITGSKQVDVLVQGRRAPPATIEALAQICNSWTTVEAPMYYCQLNC